MTIKLGEARLLPQAANPHRPEYPDTCTTPAFNHISFLALRPHELRANSLLSEEIQTRISALECCITKACLKGRWTGLADDQSWRMYSVHAPHYPTYDTDSCIRCNRCRSRKTRCLGDPPLPCAACVDVGHICVYSEAEKRVSIPER